MEFILNNRNESIDKHPLSIAQLIAIKKFAFKQLVIKINGKIIEDQDRETTLIQEGDNVVVFHLMSGG